VADRSYCAELVRQQDSDRYLTALFAPPPRRADLLAPYAFNAEVARGREAVSEPMLGHIRLQWWRDAITEIYDGEPRHHQVVQPLASAIRRHTLPREPFERLIDARELDLSDGPPDYLEQLIAYAEASSGGLTRLALFILGVSDEPSHAAGELVGTAWALTGLMRALPHLLQQGRCLLPRDVMAEKLNKSRSEYSGKIGPGLPALLTATLAEAYLARLSRLGHDPFDARNVAPLRLRSWRLMMRALAGRY
jgi:phytoene synthase